MPSLEQTRVNSGNGELYKSKTPRTGNEPVTQNPSREISTEAAKKINFLEEKVTMLSANLRSAQKQIETMEERINKLENR